MANDTHVAIETGEIESCYFFVILFFYTPTQILHQFYYSTNTDNQIRAPWRTLMLCLLSLQENLAWCCYEYTIHNNNNTVTDFLAKMYFTFIYFYFKCIFYFISLTLKPKSHCTPNLHVFK